MLSHWEPSACPFLEVAMFKAKDAMRTQVVTLSPDATIEQAIQVLVGRGISGAPVVDEAGQLVGILSEYQLLAVTYDATLIDGRVADLMTKKVVSVRPSASLGEVVKLF